MNWSRLFKREIRVKEHASRLDERLTEVEQVHAVHAQRERDELLQKLRYLEVEAQVMSRKNFSRGNL